MVGVNAHYTHYQILPASIMSDPNTPPYTVANLGRDAGTGATSTLYGSIVYTTGCHSGLSVNDQAAVSQGTDFAQVMTNAGAMFIGNTGFTYGDSSSIALSETLMTDLVTNFGIQNMTVGHALLLAKQQYLTQSNVTGFTAFDEKVLNVSTLYGLPQYGLVFPHQVPPPKTK